MRLDDPALAQLVTQLVDRRVADHLARQPQTRYGVVAAVDAANRKASIYVGGNAVATPAFSYPARMLPVVGDKVRVVTSLTGDQYVDEDYTPLGIPRFVPLEIALAYGFSQALSADSAIQVTIETDLPPAGLVAACGWVQSQHSAMGAADPGWTMVKPYQSTSTFDNMYASMAIHQVSARGITASYVAKLGGTNNRQIKYACWSGTNAGTIAGTIYVTGYWTTA